MLQIIPVNNVEWIEDTSKFNEDFIKTVMKKVMKDVQYLEKLHELYNDYSSFLPEGMTIQIPESL